MVKAKIDFYDCSNEQDMKKAEEIMNTKEVLKKEVVNFPYLMLVFEDVK